ncbi:MAG TPA: hypothetical protein GXX29_05455 [Firmicutes bacterium]|nr:hypothetical protein [Bacillota bacterium]
MPAKRSVPLFHSHLPILMIFVIIFFFLPVLLFISAGADAATGLEGGLPSYFQAKFAPETTAHPGGLSIWLNPAGLARYRLQWTGRFSGHYPQAPPTSKTAAFQTSAFSAMSLFGVGLGAGTGRGIKSFRSDQSQEINNFRSYIISAGVGYSPVPRLQLGLAMHYLNDFAYLYQATLDSAGNTTSSTRKNTHRTGYVLSGGILTEITPAVILGFGLRNLAGAMRIKESTQTRSPGSDEPQTTAAQTIVLVGPGKKAPMVLQAGLALNLPGMAITFDTATDTSIGYIVEKKFFKERLSLIGGQLVKNSKFIASTAALHINTELVQITGGITYNHQRQPAPPTNPAGSADSAAGPGLQLDLSRHLARLEFYFGTTLCY